jgi:hypothetical protein
MDMVIPMWRHIMGPQLRHRFNLVSGAMAEQLRQLAPFGLNKDHIDAVFRSEMSHREYVDKWMKSLEEYATTPPPRTEEVAESEKDDLKGEPPRTEETSESEKDDLKDRHLLGDKPATK